MNFSFLFSKCQTEIMLSKFIVQQSLDLIQGVQLSFPDELIQYELIFYVANNLRSTSIPFLRASKIRKHMLKNPQK